jgi:hypothetical protein
MVMSSAAATVISMLSVATSTASMGVALATYRRNRPRVRVGIDDFFYTTSPLKGPMRGQSRLQVSYVVANTGDRPVRVTDAAFTALVPWTALPESAATTQLVGEDGTPNSGRVLSHPRRVRWTDRLPWWSPRRHGARWQQHLCRFDLPAGVEDRTVKPFDSLAWIGGVPWTTALAMDWWRIEVTLATGKRVTSRWSRDPGDKMAIRLYAETAAEEPGAVARLRRVFARARDRMRTGQNGTP